MKKKIKKTVALTAPTGMLGSMVYNIFKDKYNLVLIYRDKEKLKKLYETYGEIGVHKTVHFNFSDMYEDYINPQKKFGKRRVDEFKELVGEIDAIVNCAGVIIPHQLKSPVDTFFINSSLPHILSNLYGSKLLHITTDCVYSGESGAPYDENSPKTSKDLYGLSKSLGEPFERSLVLRTSIIGPELVGFSSLLEWIKSNNGKTIDGYVNHFWNGLTTKQMALIFSRIIDNRSLYPKKGLFHIYSTAVSKYNLVNKIKEKYALKIKVQPKEVNKVDRRLTSIYSLNQRLKIPTLDTMLAEL